MLSITLQDAKNHLRLRHEEEDSLVLGLIEAAVDHCEGITNRDFSSDAGEPMPPAVKAACLLLIGSLYENRQAVSEKALTPVPLAFEALLSPHRTKLYPAGS